MKNYIIIIALCFSANVIPSMASDLSSAKRNLNAAQKELSQITTKRDKTQQKQEQMQAEYAKALAKIEENKDKPKSVAYKEAVKKSEALNAKIEQSGLEILSYQHQIDSLTIVVAECEAALQSAQQTKEDAETAKRHAKDSIKLVKQLAKDSAKIAKQQEREEKQQKKDDADQQKTTSNNQPENSCRAHSLQPLSDEDNNTPTESDAKANAWLVIIGVVIIVIFLWFDFKKRHHCPECGKWFTLESEGDTRVWEHDSKGKVAKRGARKKYRCTNCGHPVQFIQWFS